MQVSLIFYWETIATSFTVISLNLSAKQQKFVSLHTRFYETTTRKDEHKSVKIVLNFIPSTFVDMCYEFTSLDSKREVIVSVIAYGIRANVRIERLQERLTVYRRRLQQVSEVASYIS